MLRRLFGTLVLLMLVVGLFYTRPAWAGSNTEETNVLVRVSPLTLLLKNDVTIKVGEFTCQLMHSSDPSSVCSNLPPGEYEVRAYSEGYIVSPPSYSLIIPGEGEAGEDEDENGDDEDASAAATTQSEFYFRFYQINNELFMPTVQIKP